LGDVVMPGLIQNTISNNRRKTLKLFFTHLDNARLHNSKKSLECIQASKAKRLPHPVYSPDLAPSDFFFFGSLKEKLTTFHCTTRDELKSAIITIFNEIDRETLPAVFTLWLEWLERVIRHGGEYFNK
jgi:histone-lysine N-methyltransferase SETMAR